MIKLTVLASGSKACCTYVEIDKVPILIDNGLTYSELKKRLMLINRTLHGIPHVLVGHFHSDHVYGIPGLVKKYPEIIVYSEQAGNIFPNTSFSIHGVTITPFRLDHDVPCCGFSITDSQGNKLLYITDTGSIPCEALKHMIEPSIIICEFNHDTTALLDGSYPFDTQERVLNTHLNNEQGGDLVSLLNWDGLEHVVCFHLSEGNNRRNFASFAASHGANEFKHKVHVAMQHEVLETIVVM